MNERSMRSTKEVWGETHDGMVGEGGVDEEGEDYALTKR